MSDLTLVIGNKNYSSWSLRALAWRCATPESPSAIGCSCSSTRTGWDEAIAAVSPSGRVPVLLHGERTVWETLAIPWNTPTSWYPEAGLWPADRDARAQARAVACEMHAGFSALRTHMPMNLRRLDLAGKGRGPGVADDIARICAIWRDCRARYGAGGDFLFGAFGAADAMFAPVVTRLDTYGVASRRHLRRLQPCRPDPAGLRGMARRGDPGALDHRRGRDRVTARRRRGAKARATA